MAVRRRNDAPLLAVALVLTMVVGALQLGPFAGASGPDSGANLERSDDESALEIGARFVPQFGQIDDSLVAYSGIAAEPPTPPPGRLVPISYEVQDGDTLLEIAERFGLRSETLLWANQVADPNLIVVGNSLVIPPTDGLLYTVESGELLGGIAARYGIDPESVAAANGVADLDTLAAGLVLVLPGARPLAGSLQDGALGGVGSQGSVDGSAAAAALIDLPLPDNVADVVGAAWLRTAEPNALYSGPGAAARRHVALPAGVRLERMGELSGRRIPVRDPGDGRTRQAMSGWIDVDGLEPTRAPSPRDLPRSYPADTRMDISHNFIPYRGQLDGSAYAAANCGPTSIGMVLESFGVNVSLGRLRAEVLDAQGIWGNGTGTLMTALADVVESHGLRTYGLKREGVLRAWTVDELREQLRARRPIVVQARYRGLPGREGSYYAGDHYIVLTGVLDDGFLYNDPIDFDGPGWDRIISGDKLYRAMDASDTRFAHAAFAVGP